eukprot:2340080-Prymnesium_polylepis.1
MVSGRPPSCLRLARDEAREELGRCVARLAHVIAPAVPAQHEHDQGRLAERHTIRRRVILKRILVRTAVKEAAKHGCCRRLYEQSGRDEWGITRPAGRRHCDPDSAFVETAGKQRRLHRVVPPCVVIRLHRVVGADRHVAIVQDWAVAPDARRDRGDPSGERVQQCRVVRGDVLLPRVAMYRDIQRERRRVDNEALTKLLKQCASQRHKARGRLEDKASVEYGLPRRDRRRRDSNSDSLRREAAAPAERSTASRSLRSAPSRCQREAARHSTRRRPARLTRPNGPHPAASSRALLRRDPDRLTVPAAAATRAVLFTTSGRRDRSASVDVVILLCRQSKRQDAAIPFEHIRVELHSPHPASRLRLVRHETAQQLRRGAAVGAPDLSRAVLWWRWRRDHTAVRVAESAIGHVRPAGGHALRGSGPVDVFTTCIQIGDHAHHAGGGVGEIRGTAAVGL